jgi:ABC-type dipeptide/oligopeptide/nickel transport system permease subunit
MPEPTVDAGSGPDASPTGPASLADVADLPDEAITGVVGHVVPGPQPAPGVPAASAGEFDVEARSQVRMALQRFLHHRLAMFALVVLLLVMGTSLLGGRIAPYRFDELTSDYSQPPSFDHLMGTDAIGHDLFSQVLRGAQKSVQVALLVALLSTTIGVILGALAGYFRGWIDFVISRLTDLVLTVPVILILLVLASEFRDQRNNWMAIAVIIAVVSWPSVARVVRGIFLSLREKEFVEAARAIGAPSRRIIFRHMLPNAVGPIVVSATLTVALAILLETALAFLGLGVSAPDTSLGKLVDAGKGATLHRPWLFYFPGAVLLVICLCVNFVGDGLRDAFDPQQSRVRQ